MTSFEIERGKFYRQRCGPWVEILSTNRNGLLPVVGLSDGGDLMCFHSDGRHGTTTELDIVGPWTDQLIVDWPAMPRWAVAVAMDDDGRWHHYPNVPVVVEVAHTWSDLVTNDYGSIPKSYWPTWTGDWRSSLVVRPGHKPV